MVIGDMLKRLALVTLLFAAILTTTGTPLSCSPQDYSGPVESLTIAIPYNGINALLYTAEAQNFFAANGLNVTLKDKFDSGATATAAMLKGEADIAGATEFFMASQILNKRVITSLATIAKYENTFIIWRTDSGIKTIQDLKGKRVGVPRQTIGDFYLGRILELNGMNFQQIIPVDIRATDSEKALVNKEVDAVVTWEPFVTQINQHMAKGVVMSPIQSSQLAYWNLVSSPEWLNTHPETIKKLVKSLAQAESYMSSHEDEARAMVQKRLNYTDTQIRIMWSQSRFSLSFEQSMILAMEDESRWLISNNLTSEKQVPNFMGYIYSDTLKSAKPNAVRIAGK